MGLTGRKHAQNQFIRDFGTDGNNVLHFTIKFMNIFTFEFYFFPDSSCNEC